MDVIAKPARVHTLRADVAVTDAADSPWPSLPGPVVFLLDVASALERSMLERWIEETRPAGAVRPELVELPRRRRARRAPPPGDALDAACAGGADVVLAPLRIVWLPAEHGGRRRARPVDLVLGDPREPGRLRSRWIRFASPERVRRIAAEPATVGELRDRWRARGLAEITGLGAFVHRQALLALERRERLVRGLRYKVPRLVESEVLERPEFRGTLARIARELGRPPEDVAAEAAKDLREMAAAHSPFMMDLLAALFDFVFSRGYEAPPEFDARELERILAATERTPVAFLFSHRSHLDAMALFSMLHREGLPPSHIVGGDNMAIFPLGTIARRSGVVFIRRSFRDDPVYKATIRQYVDYLLEKRFSLSWAIEGTRSRSGKLMPPKLGMLAYVVDSWRRGRVDDVVLVPVSIAYDQIVELAEYEKEQRGGKKRAESFSWMVGFVSGIRAPHGKMYVTFGEPLSLADFFGTRDDGEPTAPDAPGLDLQKLAFEASVRINRATRVTPTSIVSLVLLESEHRAMSLGEISLEAAAFEAFARERGLPAAEALGLSTAEGLRAALDALVSGGVAFVHEDGHEPVFSIAPGKHVAAAYYRNTVLHFFLPAAVAELALLSFAKSDERVPRPALLFEIARIRDVLKFEFFFPERSLFERDVVEEIARTDPEWEAHLDRPGIRAWFDRRRPLVAAGTLRPFLEGYRIVAEELARAGAEGTTREKLLAASFGLGAQRVLQRRIANPDAATKETLRGGIELAHHRGLLEAGLEAERRELFEEIRELTRRADAIWRIAAARHADPFA